MASSDAAFKNSILARLETELGSLLFDKQPVGFSKALGKDTSGYLGLNVATRLPHHRIGIAPIVGVIHAPLEALVQELSKSSPFVNDVTLTSAVGYLTPQAKFLQWVFDPALTDLVESEIAKMIRAVREYGLPFMEEHTNLSQIIAELEAKRFTVNQVRRYRLPAAYLLARRKQEALRFVESELKELAAQTDSAASDFRDFALVVQRRSASVVQ
jgi:uncharacterized protein YqcC (DUF446 family)